MALLEVDRLSVALPSGRQYKTVVEDVSFSLEASETLCIVGESGSGKSMTAKAVIDLLPKGARVDGSIILNGKTLRKEDALAARGTDIGMVFQEPMTALNPVLTIGKQLTEASVIVGGISQPEADKKAVELLERVGIDNASVRMRQYPHEFSGGMRQRVMIGMAMMMSPKLLIADEPTTALDVTIQAQILELLQKLVQETGMGLIQITHDMGVVAETADRVLVMKDGKTVETAPVSQLFKSPEQPYTQALLKAVPRLDTPGHTSDESDVNSEPVVEIMSVTKRFNRGTRWFGFGKREATMALNNVSLDMYEGETLALVGESGSGKSTLGRAITRLLSVNSGEIKILGQSNASLHGEALRAARAETQMIFQDPYSSLNPRFTVGRTVAEPMIIQGVSRRQAQNDTAALLEKVGLSASVGNRYPHEFSGGQRQRIAIARALATNPSILVADEPTSALDVSIQAQILDLLVMLKKERSLSVLFISHDLAVVRQVATRVAVMRHGAIVEVGPTDTVLNSPASDYTRQLIASAPIPDPTRRRGKLVASEATSKIVVQ